MWSHPGSRHSHTHDSDQQPADIGRRIRKQRQPTHEQSRAENKYDTRGLEAAYLARGQSRQAAEIEAAIAAFEKMDSKTFPEGAPIDIGALVELTDKDNPVLSTDAVLGHAESRFAGTSGMLGALTGLAQRGRVVTVTEDSASVSGLVIQSREVFRYLAGLVSLDLGILPMPQH